MRAEFDVGWETRRRWGLDRLADKRGWALTPAPRRDWLFEGRCGTTALPAPARPRASRRDDSVRLRREPDGLVELTGEGGLIGIAAFLGDHADRRVGSPQTIASAFDARPRQILSGGKTEQSADALIELERRQSRSLGEIGNSQRTRRGGRRYRRAPETARRHSGRAPAKSGTSLDMPESPTTFPCRSDKGSFQVKHQPWPPSG